MMKVVEPNHLTTAAMVIKAPRMPATVVSLYFKVSSLRRLWLSTTPPMIVRWLSFLFLDNAPAFPVLMKVQEYLSLHMALPVLSGLRILLKYQ